MQTALEIAAGGLVSGASTSFTVAPFYSDGLHWQSSWHYDAIHKKAHLLYKAANANTSWAHRVYDEATDTWSDGGLSDDAPGHIYGSATIDSDTGDLYLLVWSDTSVRRFSGGTQSWDFQTSNWVIGNTSTAPRSSVVWHPNLYGPGDGGLIVDCGYNTQPIIAWRKSTDTWATIVAPPTGSPGYTGVGCYLPSLDTALVGGSNDGTATGKLITPGPSVSTGDVFPLELAGDSRTNPAYGAVVPHPGNQAKFLILQNGDMPTNGRAVYHSTDGVAWTQVADHPFSDAQGGVFCSIPRLGVIWFIGRSSQSVIWRPAV